MNQQIEDPIVMAVLAKYAERSQRGIEKYGTMLTRTDLNLTDWLNHLQEELMDATLYIEKLKQDVKFIAQKTRQDTIIDLMNSEYDEMLKADVKFIEQKTGQKLCKLIDGCDGFSCYNCMR